VEWLKRRICGATVLGAGTWRGVLAGRRGLGGALCAGCTLPMRYRAG